MAAVELWKDRVRERVVPLEDATYIVGSDAESADIIVVDPTVSGLHVSFERVGTAWLVRDLGARNGTSVDGERLTGQRRLRDGETVTLGRARLVFRDREQSGRPITAALSEPPKNLTNKERAVLVELCRPLLSHNAFQPPASVREIADRLYVGRNAVQAHLVNLYDKFGIYDDSGPGRRVVLANEAMQRGAVSRRDLEDPPPDGRRGHA